MLKTMLQHYNQGDLLKAEEIALGLDQEDPQVMEVLERLELIRRWNEGGRDLDFSEPKSWDYMPKFQKALDVIEKHKPFIKAPVLDVGCFTGYFLRHYPSESIKCGVDIHNELMKWINSKSPCNYSFQFCKAEDVHRMFKHDYFEVVTMFDVLEHCLDDEEAVASVMKVLKPKGLLVIHLPRNDIYPDTSHEHLRIYTPESVEKLIPGIEISECTDELGQPTIFGVKVK